MSKAEPCALLTLSENALAQAYPDSHNPISIVGAIARAIDPIAVASNGAPAFGSADQHARAMAQAAEIMELVEDRFHLQLKDSRSNPEAALDREG